MIAGVKIQELKMISGRDGKVMHMMKSTDPLFRGFGEVYFSLVEPGSIKGWHKSMKATKNYAVVDGSIMLVLYDGKEVQEIVMGNDNYCLVQIPPGVWSSFRALHGKKAIVANLIDSPYDPSSNEKRDPLSMTEYWKGK